MTTPWVERLSTTVIKSTAIQSPHRVELNEAGAVNDRRFFVVDADGRLISARKFPRLLLARAAIERNAGTDADRLLVQFSDGPPVEATLKLGDATSFEWDGMAWSGRPVEGPFSRAFSEHLGAEVSLVENAEEQGAVDVEPLTIVSSASIEEVGRLGDVTGPIDPRRFRMTFELGGCQAFEEDSWKGRQLAIGSAVLKVIDRVARCVVTTLDPDTSETTLDALKILAKRSDLPKKEGICFGVYAKAVQPGVISSGDTVRLM